MKPYKPLLAQDSQRLIVLDQNMKKMSFVTFMLKGLSFLALLFLTAIGFCWGISRDTVQKKLADLDQWAQLPDSQLMMLYCALGAFTMAGIWFVAYVFFFRKK